MSEFTKGKWRYVETNNTVVINDDRYIPVAFLLGCSMFSKQEYQANGRLMAAAPEMYEMMKNTANYILECAKLYSPFPGELCMYAERIKELLARIDGEKSND